MASLAVSNLFHRFSDEVFGDVGIYRDVDEGGVEGGLIAMDSFYFRREKEKEREGCEKRKKNY